MKHCVYVCESVCVLVRGFFSVHYLIRQKKCVKKIYISPGIEVPNPRPYFYHPFYFLGMFWFSSLKFLTFPCFPVFLFIYFLRRLCEDFLVWLCQNKINCYPFHFLVSNFLYWNAIKIIEKAFGFCFLYISLAHVCIY